MAEEVSIALKVNGTAVTTHPVFGDDIKVSVDKQDGEAFYRTKVSGTIKFVREDFDVIASVSHNATLTLVVTFGSTTIGTFDFIKSDTTLDYDDRVCTIKIATKDRYEDFLAKYDNKYNLPRLAPEITPLTLHKRPVLQFYFLHDKKITNVYGNMSFEVSARSGAEDYNYAEVFNRGFREIGFFIAMDIPNLTGLSSVYGRYWVNNGGSAGVGMKVYREDNAYYLEYKYDSGHLAYYWQLYYASGTAYTVNGEYVYVSGHELTYPYHEYGNSVKRGSSYTDSTNLGNGTTYTRDCYARILSDFGGDITGETKVALNTITDDVAEDNYNYLYAWSANTFDITSHLLVDDKTQDEPTEYGVDGDEKYFVKPDPSSPENAMYPIGWSMWIPFSFWFESSPALDASMRSAFDTTYQLRDAYPIHSAIQCLLTAMGVPYDFQANSPYSEFLYGYSFGLIDTIPSPKMRSNYIYITPITNVKKTRYEQPARKGDITLKQVLEMLKKVYQCYWYLDSVGRLVIEHISYFKNNQTYGLYTPTPLIDLTTMKDMPNEKMWSFDKNAFEFDRANCPSRYEFAWGNDCTEQFNGYAIDILDKWAKPDKKENMTVTNFTADIDYSVIYPQGVNDDIYAVIEAGKSGSHNVQIVDVSLGDNNPVYSMQNGYLSFLFAEQNYYNYDLGGWNAEAEGVPIPVYAVRHLCVQGVGVPLYGRALSGDFATDLAVVKTGLGIGLLRESSVNINTLYADTKVTMQAQSEDYSGSIEVVAGGYSHSTYRLQLTNHSATNLVVRYRYNGSTYTQGVSAMSFYIIATGSSPYDPNDVTILSAVVDESHNYAMGFVVGMYGTHIEATVTTTGGTTTITFNGNNYNGNDFAFVKFKVVKNSSISIAPSTENNYDYGYVATRPCATKAQVTSPGVGIVYASGSTTKTGSVSAGQEVYIGYLKDSAVSGNDSVSITISEN